MLFASMEFHEVPASPLLWLTGFPVGGWLTLQCIKSSPKLSVRLDSADSSFHPKCQVVDVKKYWPRSLALRKATENQLLVRL